MLAHRRKTFERCAECGYVHEEGVKWGRRDKKQRDNSLTSSKDKQTTSTILKGPNR